MEGNSTAKIFTRDHNKDSLSFGQKIPRTGTHFGSTWGKQPLKIDSSFYLNHCMKRCSWSWLCGGGGRFYTLISACSPATFLEKV